MNKTKRNIIIIVSAVVAAIAIVLAIVLPLTLGKNKDKTYTVTFNSNGGTVVASLTNVSHNSLIEEPAEPVREGHTFAGWFSDVKLTKQWNFDRDKVKSDLILYAGWEYNATNGLETANNGGAYTIMGIGSGIDAKDVVIPQMINGLPVTAIADYAFLGANSVETVFIPQSIKTIGNGAFSNAANLVSVVIEGEGVTLGQQVFEGCEKLQSVTLPNGLAAIPYHAFYKCKSLTKISLPSAVTEIGESAFVDCSALTEIEFSSSLTTIGELAFAGCSSLTEIALPASVANGSIGERAFNRCESLESLSIERGSGSVTYLSESNCIIEIGIKDGASFNTVIAGCKGTDLYSVQTEVHAIGDHAFAGCSGLTSIFIPSTVVAIGNYAFQDCSALENISFPASVQTVGDYAFTYCSVMHNVTFGGQNSNLTRIGRESFSYCYNLNIILPTSLDTIGAGAFYKAITTTGDNNRVTYLGTTADFDKITIESVPQGEANIYTKSDFRIFVEGGSNIFRSGLA